MSDTAAASDRPRWQRVLFSRRMLICILLGFTSGLPLYVLVQLVPAWLRTNEVDLTTIGLFALIQLPYTWKFLWAPLLDRFSFGPLGRRRGWMLMSQVAVLLAVGLLGAFAPQDGLRPIVWLVVLVAFFSATQDIVIDAYRRELLSDEELGTGNSFFVNAYRLSSLVPGALALILADRLSWSSVFWITAAFMFVGIATTLTIAEVSRAALAPQTLRAAVIDPFKEFFQRRGFGRGLEILAFMFLYKLGDNMAVALETPFLIDTGFTLSEIGSYKKIAALWGSVAGTLLGGFIMLKLPINRALWLFGFVQITSILGYALLSSVGDNLALMFAVISFEYVGVGLGSVALIAYMARETSKRFTATQFALFTSLIAVPRTLASATTGYLIEAMGYTSFFLLCTALAIPGMLLLLRVAPWNARSETVPG